MLFVYFLQLLINRTIFIQLCSKVIFIFIYSLVYIYSLLGLNKNKRSEQVLDLSDKMTIKPNEFTLPTIFNACAKLNNDRAVKVGKKLLDQMPDNFLNNTSILNSAIHMLFKFGDVKRAEDVFESIKNKDIISYGAMMNGNILVRIYIEL